MINTSITTKGPAVNVINETRDDEPSETYTRQPTIRNITVHQRFHGPHDQKRIQKSAVKYIKECCGTNYLKYYEGSNQQYALEPILVRTKKTSRLWFPPDSFEDGSTTRSKMERPRGKPKWTIKRVMITGEESCTVSGAINEKERGQDTIHGI